MRRGLTGRIFAALLAVWFAVNTGDPAMAHRCPVHGASHEVGSQAMAHAPAMHHASGEHGSAPTSGPHGCTCPSDCCASVAAVLAVADVTIEAATRATRDAAPYGLAPTRRISAVEHSRPPSIGPPRLTA